jgi:hypothetical protein
VSALRKRQQAAIEAVARHFSATWETGGGGSSGAYLTIAGRRIAVEVAVVEQPRTTEAQPAFTGS